MEQVGLLQVKRRRTVSITLEPEVIQYLDRLAIEEERNRSLMISRIVREHAEKNGRPIILTNGSNGQKIIEA